MTQMTPARKRICYASGGGTTRVRVMVIFRPYSESSAMMPSMAASLVWTEGSPGLAFGALSRSQDAVLLVMVPVLTGDLTRQVLHLLLVLIIHDSVQEFIYSLRFTCNPPVNTHHLQTCTEPENLSHPTHWFPVEAEQGNSTFLFQLML